MDRLATVILFLCMVLSVPTLVAFAVPARYFGFVVADVAMLLAVGWVWPSGPDHSSPFSGTGDAIYALLCIAIGAILALRGIVIVVRRRPTGGPAEPLAWAALGAIGAPCSMAFLSLPGAEGRPPAVAYLPALAVLAGALALLIACWWLGNVRLRAFAWGLALSALATAILAGDWAVSRLAAVVDAAEAIAGDKPYCIQVGAKRSNFIQARARIDFRR